MAGLLILVMIILLVVILWFGISGIKSILNILDSYFNEH